MNQAPANSLAHPLAAREHARAMGGTKVDAMPVLPPVADDLPEEVASEDLLWEETIAPGGYATRRLSRAMHVLRSTSTMPRCRPSG